MQYLMMRPEQIRGAVKRQVPVVICSGSVEYHGPQEPIGTDYLIPTAVIERVEKACECIVMPGLPFSPTTFWAAGPQDGEFNFDGTALENYAFEILKGLLKVGFRRIYVVQHHQGPGGLAYTSLAKAVARAVWEVCSNYYHGHGRVDDLPTENIYTAIQMCNITSFSEYAPGQEPCPIGHGSKGETQLIWGQYPETIDMSRLNYFEEKGLPFPRWLDDSHLATPEEGSYWLDFCANGFIKEFTKPYTVTHGPVPDSEKTWSKVNE